MILYPTIELLGAKPVSLYRGNLEEPEIWKVDAVEKAMEFAQAGAEWVHITDFDAIIDENMPNTDIISQVIRELPANVQVGGGIRSMSKIEEWINQGAARVVLGTVATIQPDLVKEAALLFPDQIVVAIDVIGEQVVTHGWKEQTAFKAEDYIEFFKNDALASFIVTDIDATVELSEDSLGLIMRLAGISNTPVIALGLTRSLDDLARIKFVPYVHGAIVGRALFDGSYTIEDALAVANQESGNIAPFI